MLLTWPFKMYALAVQNFLFSVNYLSVVLGHQRKLPQRLTSAEMGGWMRRIRRLSFIVAGRC